MDRSNRSRTNRINSTVLGQQYTKYQNAALLLLAIWLTAALVISPVIASELVFPVTDISIASQNEMMEKYCAICHMDAAKNGGLSLEHFDAATLSPALATILVSKFTMGVPLEDILKPEMDPATVEEIEAGKKMGAPSVMGAAGLPLPTEGEINGFIMAMAARTQDAEQWHVVHDGDEITADIIRVLSIPDPQFKRDFTYRLALTCDAASGEGEIVMFWSPVAVNGKLQAIVDGGLPLEFVLDQQESMANGDPGTSPPASVVLAGAGKSDQHPTLDMPTSSLKISWPIPTMQVEFPISELQETDRELLSACLGS